MFNKGASTDGKQVITAQKESEQLYSEMKSLRLSLHYCPTGARS